MRPRPLTTERAVPWCRAMPCHAMPCRARGVCVSRGPQRCSLIKTCKVKQNITLHSDPAPRPLVGHSHLPPRGRAPCRQVRNGTVPQRYVHRRECASCACLVRMSRAHASCACLVRMSRAHASCAYLVHASLSRTWSTPTWTGCAETSSLPTRPVVGLHSLFRSYITPRIWVYGIYR